MVDPCDAGDELVIYRASSPDERLIDYVAGSVITEDDLDIDSLQAFYLAQEAHDLVALNLGLVDIDGNFDLDGVLVRDMGEPVLDTDAATKGYVDDLVIADGNVVGPEAGEVGFVLYADAEDSWTWVDVTTLLGTAAVEDIGVVQGKIPLLGVGGRFTADQYVTMVGDAGAGGTKGACPAPAAGDAAAGKFLKADATYAIPGTGILAGMIFIWADDVCPAGYLFCNGQAVLRATYATLFALFGTTYGAGDGSTTFNMPDLRGRLALGKDNMGGVDAARVTSASTGGAQADTLGGVGGAQTHTLITAELASHTHTTTISVTTGGALTKAALGTTGTTLQPTDATGSGSAHSNTQPWQVLNYIIKT
jgi:microcystin-dependent protein